MIMVMPSPASLCFGCLPAPSLHTAPLPLPFQHPDLYPQTWMLLVIYMLLLIVRMCFNLHKLSWAIDLIVCLKFFFFFST